MCPQEVIFLAKPLQLGQNPLDDYPVFRATEP
jgi:hypothetical protein